MEPDILEYVPHAVTVTTVRVFSRLLSIYQTSAASECFKRPVVVCKCEILTVMFVHHLRNGELALRNSLITVAYAKESLIGEGLFSLMKYLMNYCLLQHASVACIPPYKIIVSQILPRTCK